MNSRESTKAGEQPEDDTSSEATPQKDLFQRPETAPDRLQKKLDSMPPRKRRVWLELAMEILSQRKQKSTSKSEKKD